MLEKVEEISQRYNLKVDCDALISDITVECNNVLKLLRCYIVIMRF